MSDGADMAIDEMLDYEEDMLDWHIGEMDVGEAYEKGVVDELGIEYEPSYIED
jgi:hypothetical protein